MNFKNIVWFIKAIFYFVLLQSLGKILNRILYINGMLFKFKKVDSPLCYFCGKEIETLEHLLVCCPRVHTFWHEVTVMLSSQPGITCKTLDMKDIGFVFFLFAQS